MSRTWSLAFLLIVAGLQARAVETATIQWTLQSAPVRAARGQTVALELRGTLPAGYHTYTTKTLDDYKSDDLPIFPTQFEIKPQDVVELSGKATYPAPKLIKEEFSGKFIEVFENTAAYTIPVNVKLTNKPGEYRVTLSIRAQICKDKCVMTSKDVQFALTVTDEPAISDAPRLTPPGTRNDANRQKQTEASVGEIRRAKNEGLAAYLWLAAGSGAAALLTPCVFPMIPITVSFFTKRKHVSRGKSIRDAGLYSLGIIFTFTVLGFLFAVLLGAARINDFATNPWVNLAIAGIFVALAGSLFGWYEIQVPTGIMNKLNRQAGSGDGVLSVLLMGLVFSLTSFTCTVPFVGAVMVSAAQSDWVWPLLGMATFATVFSAPFFLLALFPAALKSLPRSGGWLNSVKVVMGFLEIAAAMKFISNADIVWHLGLLTRNVFLTIWIALSFLVALYLLGRIRFTHDTPLERLSGLRLLSATCFVSMAIFLGAGMLGWTNLGVLEAFVVDAEYTSKRGWAESYDEALAESKRTGKPMFLDFTGYTCTNCRLMEQRVFPAPEIDKLLKQYVRVRLHTDGRKDAAQVEQSRRNQALQQERFKTTALPFYAIVSHDDKVLATFDEGLTSDVAKFASFLQSGLQ